MRARRPPPRPPPSPPPGRSRVLQRDLERAAVSSATAHGGRRSLEGGASVLFLHSEAPVPMRAVLVCFELCMLCNSRFSACVAYMRLYVPDRDRKSESRQMTPGHAFDFVSQI